MEAIGSVLTKAKSLSKARDERASIIEYFVHPLVEERRKENFERFSEFVRKTGKTAEDFKRSKEYLRPLTARAIAIKLSHIPTSELYPFFKQCVEYSNKKGGTFSRAFFGALKTK